MPDKITKQQFAQRIKEKYPDYKDIDDNELADKMLNKYPDYKSSIITDGAGGGFGQFKTYISTIYARAKAILNIRIF